MKIGVLGTGTVGRALAGRLTQLGHAVWLGTRDVEATLARTEPDAHGNPPLLDWLRSHGTVVVDTFEGAATHGELVINATSGAATLDVLASAGAENLAGKVLLDISNPLDFAQGFPPTLSVKDTDSLAEQVQRAYPEARVVKALNTLTAALMVNPAELAHADHTVFVSGDDADAKELVTGLLRDFGHTDVIDLGALSTARGTEMLLPLWLRLMGTLGTGMFNIKVVR